MSSSNWPKVAESLREKKEEAIAASVSDSKLTEDQRLELERLGVDIKSRRQEEGLSPEEKELQNFQIKNIRRALKESASLRLQITNIEEHIKKLLSPDENGGIPDKGKLDIVKSLRERQSELSDRQRSIAESDPDAFMAIHGREIRALKRQLEGGRIVETDFVKSQLRKIMDGLNGGLLVFIHGETGTGKTEIAKIAAKRHSGKEAILVRGYPGMDSGELFGHHELKKSGVSKPADMPEKIQKQIEQFEKSKGNPATPAESKQITEAALRDNNVTVSDFLLGAVYRAAKDGEVLIIDEANYIPPPLLAKLNDILTKKPGEFINVQEGGVDPIEVKKGFSIIMTGNINVGSSKRYANRHELDPALIDRSVLVEHNYLPQALAGKLADHDPAHKQLYSIVVAGFLSGSRRAKPQDVSAMMEDRIGTMVLPGGEQALDELWRLSQFAAVTQRAFSGQISSDDPHTFQSGAVSTALRPDLSLSPRGLIRLIEDWRGSGFEYELDHYLHKHLIDRSLKAVDRAYFYQLGQKFGFFKSAGWETNPGYGTQGKVDHFVITDPCNKPRSLEIVPGVAVVESIYGEAPARTQWPGELAKDAGKIKRPQDKAKEWIEAQKETEEVVKDLESLLGRVDVLQPQREK